MKFPVLAKYIGSYPVQTNKIIILFTGPTSGIILYNGTDEYEYPIGHRSDFWIRVTNNENNWKLLTGLDDMVSLL